MRVLVAQSWPRADSIATAEAVLAKVDEVVTDDVAALVLPEHVFTGVDGSTPTATDGQRWLERLIKLARRHRTYVLTGSWPEDGPGGPEQVARLLNPAGDVALTIRRRIEPDGSTGTGTDFPVIDTDFGRVGVLLGPDFWLVEPPRAQCLRGAELLLVATSFNGRDQAAQRAAVWGIATLNTVAVAVAGALSGGGRGGSAVALPQRLEAQAESDDVVIGANVDVDHIRHLRKPDLRFQETLWFGLWARRPELYPMITHHAERGARSEGATTP